MADEDPLPATGRRQRDGALQVGARKKPYVEDSMVPDFP
jgi:hypothetical protein